MGDARQKLFAALFVAQSLFHRMVEPLRHFIEVCADRGELIVFSVDNAKIQVPVADLVDSIRQEVQRLLDFLKDEPSQKAIGQQNRRQYGEQQYEDGTCRHRFQDIIGNSLGTAEQKDAVGLPVNVCGVSV